MPTKNETPPRIFVSSPAAEVVTISARGKPAIAAAENIFPAIVLADLAVAWILPSLAALVSKVVMVTVDPQSLLQLCQLLLASAWIRREVSGNAAGGPNAYASGSACLEPRLVVVSAVAMLPLGPAAIAEFCFAATSAGSLAALRVRGAKLSQDSRHVVTAIVQGDNVTALVASLPAFCLRECKHFLTSLILLADMVHVLTVNPPVELRHGIMCTCLAYIQGRSL